MSVEATNWAFGLSLSRSSAKFVLVAMANCAGHDMTCWPSVKYIADATGQDRKTVLGNIARLIDEGYIIDTGYRRGRTGQIPIYLLNVKQKKAAELQEDDEHDGDYSSQNAAFNSTENGTVKQSQKRNSSENGTVPFFPPNSTVFPRKESRFSAQRVPKTGHGTVKEPSLNRNGTHPTENQDGKSDVATIDPAVGLSIAFRKNGVNANAHNPYVIELAKQGVTPEVVQAACGEAKASKGNEPIPLRYVVSIINRWARESSAVMAQGAKVPGKSGAAPKFNPVAYVNQYRRNS